MTAPRRLVPDLRILQAFEAAARHGSFTRAGEELHLTQSAVSRQIKELEDQTGKVLFDRLRGRVVLSEAGRSLLPQVERLLSLSQATMRHALAGPAGEAVLAVNALPSFASRWLMPRLPGFLAAHPGLRVDLTTKRELFDFSRSGCDLAIHFGQPLWPGGSCTYLCSEIVLPVAGGALRDGPPVARPEDLIGRDLLHLTTRPGLWPDWFAAQGIEGAEALRGHWMDQFSLTIEAALAGMGYALLPQYLIEAELESGALKVMLDQPHATDLAYWIVTPEGHGDAPLVAAFRDWLVGEVRFRPLAQG
ncbi:LysR substrate-binding domain-containing protein [Pseudooceanicola nanhaiensis]|uniref:LysR substrate-binding domain-containing protein n=1 Tax=Pseudooceanicola nanhaiensis TaxID=375761 RepID=UPI001CD6D184|nr:LysR substrate-binding domain-containing protein [Pseudooceanicola nanhaiensis]MCA0922152.1 LysR family transcriptional regulator [Pseudooceanicola nanhaiensis]